MNGAWPLPLLVPRPSPLVPYCPMFDWVNTLVQGILLGGLYALFAMGQSLIFGVMRLTNTAHGDFIILAAFGAFSLAAAIGLPPAVAPWVALVLLLPVAFAAGYGLQRFVLNGTLGRDPLPSLVVTFGLAIVIQNLLQEIFTADPRSIESGGLNTASICIGRRPGGGHAAAVDLRDRRGDGRSPCNGCSTTRRSDARSARSATTATPPN